MFRDTTEDGSSNALNEAGGFFERQGYEVEVVELSGEFSEQTLQRAATKVDEGDLVLFANAGGDAGRVMERILSLSSHAGLRARNDSLQAHNDTLTRNNADLQGRNDSLRAHNDSLQADNDTLARDNAALQGRNDTLQADNDTLVRDNAALQGRNDSLSRDNADLQGRNDTLQADNDTLTRSNADLKGRNSTLQASNDTLTRDNADLQGRNNTLTRDNADLQGKNDTLTKDNAALQGRNNTLQADNDSLTRDNAALQADNIALWNESREDALTKVLNRRGYEQDARQFIQRNELFILICVDINDFKLFNDIYGHNIGDQVLISLAGEFRTLVQRGDIIARSGGDEFQLLVARPNAEFMQQASDFFNSVHSLEYGGQKYTYTLSAGFASWPEQTSSFSVLTKMADSALYHAKMLSREKFWKYEPDMDNDLRASLGFNARNLAETAPGAMLICKADGRGEILFANPVCARLFGYGSLSEFTTAVKYFLPVIDPEDKDRVDAYLARMAENPDDATRWEKCVSYRICRKDGTMRSIKTVGRMIANEHFGEVFYAFLFDCGITGEKG